VSMCWKLPARYSTTYFKNDVDDDSNAIGDYCYSLGPEGSCGRVRLVRGDACNNSGSHIVLFDCETPGGAMITMEQTPDTARKKKRYYSDMDDYQPIRRMDLRPENIKIGTVVGKIITNRRYQDD